MDGATSLKTKENLYFVYFDSIKNSPWSHIDMNFGFSSFGLRIDEVGFITKIVVIESFFADNRLKFLNESNFSLDTLTTHLIVGCRRVSR